MSKRTRRPAITPAQIEMLKAAQETGHPFAAGYSGGRVNVFKALVRAGYLSGDGGLTAAGSAALDRWSSRNGRDEEQRWRAD